jgi:hypothetical protein
MGFLIAAAIIVIALGVLVISSIGRKSKPKTRKPWQEICQSLENHPEEWKITRRQDKEAEKWRNKYGIIWTVTHPKTKIVMGFFRDGKTYWEGNYKRQAKNDLVFYTDSKIKLELTGAQEERIWESVQVAMTKKLKADMNPETVEYRDGFFFCPHCGEKVAVEVVNENRSE